MSTQIQPKRKGAAIAWWFFLGGFGAHRFYLGDFLRGILMCLGVWVGTMFFFVASLAGDPEAGALGLFLVAGTALWILVDGVVLMCRGHEFYVRKGGK